MAMYIVISIPKRKSTACGVSHFICLLLTVDSTTAAKGLHRGPIFSGGQPRREREHHDCRLMIIMSYPPATIRHSDEAAHTLESGRHRVTAAFVIVLILLRSRRRGRASGRRIEAANRVAAQLLGRLAMIYSAEGGPELALPFLQEPGHVRANDIVLRSMNGEEIYRSPLQPTRQGAPPLNGSVDLCHRRRPSTHICCRVLFS